MQITYQVSSYDFYTYAQFMLAHNSDIRRMMQRTKVIHSLAIAITAFFALLVLSHGTINLFVLLGACCFGAVAYPIISARFDQRFTHQCVCASLDGQPDRTLNMTVSLKDDGFHTGGEFGATHVPWTSFRVIEENRTHIFIRFSFFGYITIPKSAFATVAESNAFVKTVEAQAQQAQYAYTGTLTR